MTTREREQIRQMRREGMGYVRIANALSLSENTVKSYCQRSGLGGSMGHLAQPDENRCAHCAAPLQQRPGCKPKRFCSDVCRKAWWYVHRHALSTAKSTVCRSCGVVFRGNSARKYCSRACYARHRYGGGQA